GPAMPYAWVMVRNGCADVPGLESLPWVDTYKSAPWLAIKPSMRHETESPIDTANFMRPFWTTWAHGRKRSQADFDVRICPTQPAMKTGWETVVLFFFEKAGRCRIS